MAQFVMIVVAVLLQSVFCVTAIDSTHLHNLAGSRDVDSRTKFETDNPRVFGSPFDGATFATSNSENLQPLESGLCCPSGWLRYGNSCFYIERIKKMNFRDALNKCFEMQSTLWTPDNIAEWESVRRHAVVTQWTWFGLRAGHHPSGIYGAHWSMAGGMNSEQLPWLNNLAPHGMTQLAECVAYFYPLADNGRYVNFYPCSYMHFYICERNLNGMILNPTFT